jgi:hypothetical protein
MTASRQLSLDGLRSLQAQTGGGSASRQHFVRGEQAGQLFGEVVAQRVACSAFKKTETAEIAIANVGDDLGNRPLGH